MANLDQAAGQYQQARSYLLPQLNLVARQSWQTINLLGYGIDLPGSSQQSAAQLIGPFASMDARVSLRRNCSIWRTYDRRKVSVPAWTLRGCLSIMRANWWC